MDCVFHEKEPERTVFEAFLREYEALIRKHGVFIGGCGCCDSPFMEWFSGHPEDWTPEKHIAHLERVS